MNFWEWYDRQLLAAQQNDISQQELEWLILRLTFLDKLDLRLRSPNITPKITPEILTNLDHLWQKRLGDRLPVQYLTGSVTWRNLELQVSPAVLIPRPETELIIDIIAASCQTPIYQQGIWLDLGTGSGAIAIALAQQFPDAQVHAIDLSKEALAIAQVNAAQNQQSHQQLKIHFHHGSWFTPAAQLGLQQKVIGIVSNPPYIPSDEVLKLQPEVKNHEPHLALDGGRDGLNALRELVAIAPEYLMSGGFWIVEMMAGQATLVQSLLENDGRYTNIKIHPDYAGIDRFISAYRR
jgi:release factor glutamine methyltransferase